MLVFKELLMLKQELLERISQLLSEDSIQELSDLIRQAKKDGMCEYCYILSEGVSDGIYAAYRLSVANEKSFTNAVKAAGLQVKEIVFVQENGFRRCLSVY